MTVPVAAIANALRADGPLATVVFDRIFDRDLRRAGSGATDAIFDPANGQVLPSVMVDDAGGGRNPFAGSSSVFQDRCYVWIFTPRNDAGRTSLATATARVTAILHRWRDPATGVSLFYGDRVGEQTTDAPASSYMERLSFLANGVLAGAEW